jgi:hypothetical protein
MDQQWVRTYRPDPDRFDERPVVLSGGYITSDPEDLALFASAALAKRGHVILQRHRPLEDFDGASYAARRAREASALEKRW